MSTTLVSRTANAPALFTSNQGVIPLVVRVLLLLMVALILGALAPTTAHAAVTLRVEARPVSAPIGVWATVTDANGGAVSGLTAADFQVLVDGVAVGAPSFSLPPAQGPGQKVSIVFAMDYSSSVRTAALVPMQEAVIAFINSMRVGEDYAAIVKFNGTNPNRASVVQPFTQIDGASGTAALINAVNADYPGEGSNVFDGTMLSVQQFTSPPIALPNGPKAIVLVTDGGENSSSADINAVVLAANAAKVAVFTIGVGNFTETSAQQILTGLATQTSAAFYPAPSAAQIGEAYVQVSRLLNNEYLLTFQSGIADCNSHSLELRVTGQAAATTTFTRCTPLLVPDVRSQTQAAATTELSGLGLNAGTVTQQASFTVAAGSVISQQPPVGTVVAAGTAVNLVVSSGPPVASSSGGGGAIDPMELLMGLLLVTMLWTLRVKGKR